MEGKTKRERIIRMELGIIPLIKIIVLTQWRFFGGGESFKYGG
jgi:hypothetical protein